MINSISSLKYEDYLYSLGFEEIGKSFSCKKKKIKNHLYINNTKI